MTRSPLIAGIVTVALVGAVSAAGPNDNWPQFRGPPAGVAADDPALPDDLERHRERRLEDRRARAIGWSSPVVWGDHVFLTTVVNTGAAASRRSPGSISGRTGPRLDGAAPLDGLRRRFQDRQDSLGARGPQRACRPAAKHLKNSYASETPVTDGERVYFYFGNVGLFAFDMDGKPVWSKPMGPFKTRQRLGHRRFARRSTAIASTSSTTTTSSRSSPRTTSGPARRSGASTATKGPTGRRRSSGRTSGAPRSSRPAPARCAPTICREAAVGAQGHVVDQHPDAVRPARAAVHQLRATSAIALRPAYAIRPGASGDISLKPGETSNEYIAWSAPTARPVQPDAARVRRLLLHAARPRLLHRATMRRPARRSTAGSASPPTPAASRRRRGRTTARSSR